MVRVFFRLKIKTLRGRFKVAPAWSLAIFVLVWVAAGAFGVLVGFGVGALARQLDSVAVLSILFTVVTGMWVVLPVLAASIEQSLDPDHFMLLPITPAQMAQGMFVSSAVGPATTATFLMFVIASVWGFGSGLLSGMVLVLVAVVATGLALLAANVVTTGISVLFVGGRWKQGAAYLLMLVMLTPAMTSPFLLRISEEGNLALPSWLPWLYLLPPAALGRGVMGLIPGGDPWQLVLGVTYGLASAWILIAIWGRLLGSERVATPQTTKEFRSGAMRGRTSGPARAVAAKEWLYFKRDPRIKMQIGGGMIGVLVVFVSSTSDAFGVIDRTYLPFMAIMVSFILGATFDFNLFGLDGKSFWVFAVTPTEGRSVLLGKQVVWLGIATITSVVVVIGSGFLGGDPIYFGPALLSAFSLATIWAGVGMVGSVYAPFPLPEGNLFANKHMSGTTMLVTLLGLVIAGAATAIPLGLVVWAVVRLSIGLLWVISLGAAIYGIGVFFGSLRLASSLFAERQVEMVLALDSDQ